MKSPYCYDRSRLIITHSTACIKYLWRGIFVDPAMILSTLDFECLRKLMHTSQKRFITSSVLNKHGFILLLFRG